MLTLLISVNGVIMDESGEPVPYAYVSCGRYGSYTDDEGFFNLPVEPPCTLRVEHIAYRDTSIIVSKTPVRIILKESAVRFSPSVVKSVPPDMVSSRKVDSPVEDMVEDPGINMDITPTGMSLTTGRFPSRFTLILVDGMPVYGRIFGGVDLFTIPVDDMEKVEIISGSSSAIYGSNAVGGVVNIITGGNFRTRFTISSQGDVSLRGLMDRNFNSRIYMSRRIYQPLEIYLMGTSFEKPFRYRMDFSRKFNRESRELIRDSRIYFSHKGFYLNVFSHVYYRRRALKSYTDEYHISYGGEKGIYRGKFLINFRYGFHLYGAFSSLIPGLRGDYEIYGVGEYVGERLRALVRAALIGGKPVILPQVSFSFGNFDFYMGTGYRAPSLKEKYLRFDFPEIGYRILGNPDLMPEFSISSSVSYSSGWLRLSLSYGSVWNYIDARVVKQDSRFTEFTFVNRSRFRTFAADGSIRLHRGDSGFALSWRLGTGEMDMPSYKVSLEGTVGIFNLRFITVGESEFLPSYRKLSLYLKKDVGSVQLRAGVEDVFNWTEKLNLPFFKGRYVYAEIRF